MKLSQKTGLTLNKLAKKAGLSPEQLTRLVDGKTGKVKTDIDTVLSGESLFKLAKTAPVPLIIGSAPCALGDKSNDSGAGYTKIERELHEVMLTLSDREGQAVLTYAQCVKSLRPNVPPDLHLVPSQ